MEINKLTSKFKERLRKTNITRREWTALKTLKRQNDVVIKPADKGGAVVVWARHLYVRRWKGNSPILISTNSKTMISLSTTTTQSCKRVVKEATSQHGTTRLCYQHLIIDSPCTFKLFRPKPTNPAITTALVISLPSFVKDT